MVRLSALALALSVIAMPSVAMDAAHCRQLVATYDRLAPEYDVSRARHDRVRGEQECLKGNFAGGEKLLESALLAVGYRPPAG